MYLTKRQFSSTVHIYTFDPNEYELDINFGEYGKLELLSKLGRPETICKINGGMFGSKKDNLGTLVNDSLYYNAPVLGYTDLIFTKDLQLLIKDLQSLDEVAYWQEHAKWVIGTSFTLIENGKISIRNKALHSHWKEKHPRTAIGQCANGDILLVVVDGRRVNEAGMTATQLATTMFDLGCIDAINLDGGGSSEMIVNNQIINNPSDGHERPIGTALVVSRKEANMNNNYTIALDDGHGIETAGKRTPAFPDGKVMRENEFNSAVVELLDIELKRCGFNTLLVAPGDTDIYLSERVNIANSNKADLFVSVHANAMTGKWGNAKGIETYHYPNSVNGKRAAEIIHRYLIQGTPFEDRGIKSAKFYVLKYTNMPGVLVECGFMDNMHDATLLLTGAYRLECAQEIAKGICEYFGVQYIADNSAKDWKKKFYDFRNEVIELIEKYKI